MTALALLRINGHSVEWKSNIDAALSAEVEPDVVLFDMATGSTNVMRLLRGRFPNAKVLAIGGKDGSALRANVLRHGFDSFLAKPIRASVVERVMNSLAEI